MIGNNEIKNVNDFLKQNTLSADNAAERESTVSCSSDTPKSTSTTATSPSGINDALLQKIEQGFRSVDEKEKTEMSRWLENALDCAADFSALVIELVEAKGYKNDYPRFYNKAEIDRRLFSKIISLNQSYHPDIKTVYKIIIGLELNVEQANELLRAASYSFGGSLYSLIIRYCVENGIFEHKKIDEYLMKFCGETLFSIK